LLKILFIHEVSYRKKVIFEMHEFPELLALRGHDISFLEFDEGRKFWQKGQAPRSEVIQGRVHPDARINLSRPFQVGIPGVDRIVALFTVLPTLRKLFKNNNFDAVVLYAVPTYGLQTLWLAKRFKVPVLFRALDVSHKIRSSVLSPVIKWVEKRIYKKVDLFSANNAAMADYCKELGERTKPTLVHYPPLDLSHFQQAKRDQGLRESLGLKAEDRVITYMGSFFYFSGLKDALLEFALTAEKNWRLKLLLIGGGEQEVELRKLVQNLGIQDQTVFTGFVGYKDLPKYLKIADVAVNTLQTTLVANVAFPNKVLQYMAVGLPVVSTRLQGLHQTFGEDSGIAWAEDARAVMKAAIQLVDKTDVELTKVGQLQLSAVSKIFSVEAAVDKFEESLTNISGKRSE
jgi:glycosyltransferase involved in cell wall biosynthesis